MHPVSETLSVTPNLFCGHIHSFDAKSDNQWKSPIKIMRVFNVTSSIGINNLWKKKPTGRNWTGLAIAVFMLLLISMSEARPASAMPRAIRDHSRYIFQSSSTTGSYMAQKPLNSATSNSSAEDLSVSLSIFSPLDILRQNMLLEIQRKRVRHAKHRQMQSNKAFLDRIGR